MGLRGKGSLKRRAEGRKVTETPERLEVLLRNACTFREKRRLLLKLRKANKEAKTKRRRERVKLEAEGVEVTIKPTKTIETLRRPDPTLLADGDEEVKEEDEVDEFAEYFKGTSPPKLMVTTVFTNRPSRSMIAFVKEFVLIFPNTFYYKRQKRTFDTVVKCATRHDFTDILVFNQQNGKPSGLYICHLPDGPTSYFRLTGLKLAQDMKGGGVVTDHQPEIILNNFDTRLGHRLGRQLAALFPQRPEFEGRRVITFHNQRDFVFFRHHRYVFKDSRTRGRKRRKSKGDSDEEFDGGEKKRPVKCYLKEIGPRFTLKLRTMQLGTFDDSQGLFEFAWRAGSQADRKTFFI